MINVVVIDDESLGRKRILRLLQEYPDFLVVGTCSSADQGYRVIKEKRPDVVFLDIQMPGLSGMDLWAKLKSPPLVVFVTAHEQYALRAFAVKALDYLLKPFSNERFQQAIEAIRQRLQETRSAELSHKMLQMVRGFERSQNLYLSEVKVKHHGREQAIDLSHVLWFEAAGNYVSLHTMQAEFLYRGTIAILCEQLDPAVFVRIHRGTIVNMAQVVTHNYLNNNQYRFNFGNQSSVTSSRRFKNDLDRFFEERKGRGPA